MPLSSNKSRSRRSRNQGQFLLFLIICGIIAIPFLPWKRPEPEVVREVVREVEYVDRDNVVEKVVEKVVETKEFIADEPLPKSAIDYSDTPTDIAKLYSGIMVKTDLNAEPGETAVVERKKDESYNIEFKVNIKVPKANDSVEELTSINSHLPAILPGLTTLMQDAKVSSLYHRLYDIKTKRIQTYLTRLRSVPSRHNYYDCETVLELTHPTTKQRALLIQGEMDVVSDGSDGDRSPEYDEYIANSQHYQPFTSYGWRKQTSQPNPLLQRWEDKLATAQAEYTKNKQASTLSSIEKLKREITDLKARSFLVARKDPFVVIPLSFLGYHNSSPFGPQMGDYVVVIHEDKIYPAILGDAGPTYKTGEASLRIAQTINPKASPYNRPVSNLTVTYVIFPQSRETPFSAPNLDHWHQKCLEYLNKIGGIGEGYTLHKWEDLFAKAEEEEEEENASVTEDETGSVEDGPESE